MVDGEDGGMLDSVETFGPVTGTWTTAPASGVPRRGHTTTLLADGHVLVTGGDELNLRPGV
jgi:hypothetical protein